ncbi:tetratricopeptide repeat protein [Paludifilum halophilum]|uniref:HTH cro/C1-type domain-containing protein n=1 Tax=Paludifilum halophilum TaxID=1642702 RepID=A0A235B5U5_9BACL|nr:tetratricopeptide repeat protein [Paludifilum halophilum]OYD07612.1 hypothetical protein CHM34_09015 [Paludifilum halophilum]
MSVQSINEIGEVIRNVRKERGLRLQDLADDQISSETISHIESGVPSVNQDQTRYLMEKLNIEMGSLPELMMNEQIKLQKASFQLEAIESLIDFEHTDEAMKRMNELALDDGHPFAAIKHYLQGKYHYKKNCMKKAEHSFFNAIRLSKQSPYGQHTNIEAASFNELSVCSYFQNRLEQAIDFTNSGLDAFVEGGDRKQIQYILTANKLAYLEEAGRLEEALNGIQTAWKSLSKINKISVVLHLYELRTHLLRKTQMYNEAIRYAREGLEIARSNQDFRRAFELWSALGNTYLDMKKWNQAETCFHLAISLKENSQYKNVIITTYTQLGILYLLQEKWEPAKEALNQAILKGNELNDSHRLHFAYLVIGDCYRKQGKNQEAVPFYQKALDLAVKHQYKSMEHTSWFRLAQCWESIDKKEFDRCKDNMYKVQKKLNQEEVENYEIPV